MNFRNLLSQLGQLSEAKEEVKPGVTKVTGKYGKEYDASEEDGDKKKADSGEKRGRGRPKKGADETGEVKKYDTSSIGKALGAGSKPKKEIGKVSKKHSLKEYFDQLDQALNEGALDAVRDRMQSGQGGALNNIRANMQQRGAGASAVNQVRQGVQQRLGAMSGKPVGEGEQVTMEPAKQNTQVIKQGSKTLGTVSNPQLAAQIKQSIGKGEMSLAGDELGEGDVGKHNNATTGFDALVKKLTPKYGVEAAKRIAGSQLKKIKEAERPTNDSDFGAGLGAGRSQGVLEAKKPDVNPKDGIPDYAQDGKGKNDLKKKKVKEGMDHKLKAAHHAGKAHALSKQGYNCSYDDMEESRMYHEGFKEGLDECYGQMPIQGYVGEMGQSTVDDMASFGAHTPELDEVSRGDWMKQQAKSTPGDTFKAFGQTMQDKDVLEMDSMFESWDNELNSLLEEYDTIQEGMTVSISKGQQGAPDSVSVSAQDGEADQLLSIIKQAGLGLFGGDEPKVGQSSAMSLQPADTGPEGSMEIGVVDDHDGMMDLIRKVTGGAGEPNTVAIGSDDGQSEQDYEDEQGHEDHEHTDEEACNECGMAYESCGCDDNKEVVDEVESEDQMAYEVAEDNAPDSEAAETTADENAEAAEDSALATADAGQDAEDAKVYSSTTNEAEDETGEEAGKKEMAESSFFSLYKKLAMISEESTSEKDDKAEKAAKKVAKDIEYDEGHKGKDDNKAEEAGKKVKKDIEYDDKKDKKLDEWANEAGKKGTDEQFETDIAFMTKVIAGGLNKEKIDVAGNGQSTVPVTAVRVNESVNAWKKLAGIK